MEELSLEVTDVDCIEIDQAECADAGRGQIHGDGRPEPTRADDECGARSQAELPVHPNLGKDEVARVAKNLFVTEGILWRS